jgi:hypothetical protein
MEHCQLAIWDLKDQQVQRMAYVLTAKPVLEPHSKWWTLMTLQTMEANRLCVVRATLAQLIMNLFIVQPRILFFAMSGLDPESLHTVAVYNLMPSSPTRVD